MSFANFPVEILDRIADFLDSPTDIRHFAQVSTQLHQIASPRHTQFRTIRSPLRSSIWGHFITNRSLAKNVRTLELQRTEILWNRTRVDPPVVPSVFEHPNEDQSTDDDNANPHNTVYRKRKNANDLRAERVFVSALKNMTGLTSFVWSRTPPLIKSEVEADVWSTLATHCPNLHQLEVLDGEISADEDHEDYQRMTHNPTFFTLKNLKSLVLVTDVGTSLPDMTLFAKMLATHSPDLEVLRLAFQVYYAQTKNANASPLLSRAHWKSLRQLCLLPVFAPSPLVSTFLVSHPTLEHLSLVNHDNRYKRMSVSIPSPLLLPPGSLPSLKYINATWEDLVSFLSSPTTHPRPLERILGPPLDDAFLDLLEKSGSGPTLNELCVTTCASLDLVVKLGKIAPGIEWLDLSFQRGDLRCPQDWDWCSALAHLPSLTTLLGVRLLLADRPSEANSKTLQALMSVCPKLRRLSWYSPAYLTEADVFIEREGTLVKWGLRARLGYGLGDAVVAWGERGRGSFEL